MISRPAHIKVFVSLVEGTLSDLEVLVFVTDNMSPDTKTYKSNMVTLYELIVKDNAISSQKEHYYNYVTLKIEGLYTIDFSYYPEYELLVLADRQGKVHYLYKSDQTGQFVLHKSDKIPDTMNTLLDE